MKTNDMKESRRAEAEEGNEPGEDALDEDALDQATGGAGLVAHELAHTVQGANVGGNETITIHGSRTETVDTPSRKP